MNFVLFPIFIQKIKNKKTNKLHKLLQLADELCREDSSSYKIDLMFLGNFVKDAPINDSAAKTVNCHGAFEVVHIKTYRVVHVSRLHKYVVCIVVALMYNYTLQQCLSGRVCHSF